MAFSASSICIRAFLSLDAVAVPLPLPDAPSKGCIIWLVVTIKGAAEEMAVDMGGWLTDNTRSWSSQLAEEAEAEAEAEADVEAEEAEVEAEAEEDEAEEDEAEA